MKRYFNNSKIAIAVLLLLPVVSEASGGKQGNAIMEWMLNNIFLVLAGLIIFGVGMALWNLTNTLVKDKQIELLRQQGIEMKDKEDVKKESLFKKLHDKAWRLAPMEKEADIDLGHDYDGIRELDNRLPPWWVYMFYLTIIWGLGYAYVFHFSDLGLNQKEEYAVAVKKSEEVQRAYLAKQANAVDENSVVAITDANELEAGKTVYLASCVACHGAEGQGGVGPNMTDKFWIHGGSINDVFKIIKYGAPEKGMISWKSQLSPKVIQNVSSYILTLQGTNPPNPKEPQGEEYIPEG